MLGIIESILKILFFILSIIWMGKIMTLKTDKQIVINPLLFLISSLLVVIPQSKDGIKLMAISIQNIRIILYCIYSVIIILGLYATNRKNNIF